MSSSFPDTFYCTLTGQIMENPVTDPEGYNYEQSEIVNYLNKNGEVSPVTSNPLKVDQLQPNAEIKAQIDAIRSQVDDATRFRNLRLLKTQQDKVPVEKMEEEEEKKVDDQAQEIKKQEAQQALINGNKPWLQIERMSDYVRVKVSNPVGTQRSLCDICCVIDVSGSMASEVTAKDESGKSESFGLTCLDLVKHSVKTLIANLSDKDRLSIVSFTDSAEVVTNLIKMDEEGKEKSIKKLEHLEPLNSTNIWDGIAKGLNVMKEGQKNQSNDRQAFSQILLFTDGLPNVIPPRGHIPMLKKYKEDNPDVNCAISTFGFGYSLDSALLNDLAIEGKGSYAFIPDGQFVGTVFVNALSNLMTTMAVDATLCLENAEFAQFASDSVVAETSKEVEINPTQNVMGDFDNQKVSWGVNANIGSLQFGQSRDIILRLKNIDSVPNKPYLTATLKYKTSSNAEKVEEVSAEAIDREQQENIAEDVFRCQFVETIKEVVAQLPSLGQKEQQDKVVALIERIKAHPASKQNAFLKDLLTDLTGQVTEALQTMQAFNKWGKHYLPSLARAHQTQQCNNFKDPGVQHYGGKLFNSVRDLADEQFLKMPPPKPSIQKQPQIAQKGQKNNQSVASKPVNMKNYYCNSAPCFDGNSLVKIEVNDNACPSTILKKVSDIRAGDMVVSPAQGGQAVKVVCVLRTICSNNQAYLVELSDNLLITPYHPVRVNGNWSFPCDIKEIKQLPCQFVYSFVLESGHSMEIGGIECVTYAHGFQEEVVRHQYFGTQRIIDDLKQMDGWESGYVTLPPNCLIRDPISRLVIGLTNDTNNQRRTNVNQTTLVNQEHIVC